MPNCNTQALLDNIGFEICVDKQPGGVSSKMFAVLRDSIASMAVNSTTGELSTLTLKSGGRMYSWNGKKFKNTGNFEFVSNESGPDTYNQSATFVAYTETQKQTNALNALTKQDGWTVFIATNAGKVKVYGYSLPPYDNLGSGLKVKSFTGTEGTAMADDTSKPITFSGSEMNPPILYAESSGYVGTLDFLDALVVSTTPA